MVEILNRCNYLYNNLVDCTDKNTNEHKAGCCLNCTKSNFRSLENDSYDCLKKLCTYTMFYGPIYVSEIYHFLVQSHFIETSIYELRMHIKRNSLHGFTPFHINRMIPVNLNIMSLGCGFGPDNIALNKYKDTHLDDNVNFAYKGYDIEPLWNYITHSVSLPTTYDLLNGMNFENVDILFLNKLFSTLKNLRLHRDFLNVFEDALDDLPIGSFVVFNDVNNYNEGRDIFDEFAQRNSLEVVSKFYSFQQHYTDWIELENTNNICTVPNNLAINTKSYFTDLVFFLYKKV